MKVIAFYRNFLSLFPRSSFAYNRFDRVARFVFLSALSVPRFTPVCSILIVQPSRSIKQTSIV